MLTATELAAMQEAQNGALPSTATILRYTTASDGQGGQVATLVTPSATAACRVSSRGVPDEFLQDGRAAGRALWLVTLAADADVLATDRLSVSGKVYEILGFASGGAWATAKRVICVEVQ